jgi:hypothetical protein
MTEKQPRYLWNSVFEGRYVRAWREGRGRNADIVVQVWNGTEPDGEPACDWAMPGRLPLDAAIAQASIQTPKERS